MIYVICMSHFLPRYFAHPENLLLCGLLSPFSSDAVREKSLEKILEARKKQKGSKAKNVRKFIPPSLDKFNFDADNIFDLLKWERFKRNHNVTPPPLLSKHTDDELRVQSQDESQTLFRVNFEFYSL